MGWAYGVMGETQITASRATLNLAPIEPCKWKLAEGEQKL